jgi:signal transduction histidine kinase
VKFQGSPLNWSNRLLITMALLVPAVMFAGAAWKTRVDAVRAGENEIVRSLVEMRDHMAIVFKVEELTLTRIDDHIRGLSWAGIAEPSTGIFLRALAAEMAGVESVRIADRAGMIRAASDTWEPGARVGEQQFFEAEQQPDSRTYLSTVFAGEPARIASVDMVRRRSTDDGLFDGTIHLSLNTAYLVHLLAVAAPVAHDVLLVRNHGQIITSYPQSPNRHLSRDGPLMRHIAAQSAEYIFADGERLYSYIQLPGFPAYLSLGVSESAILQRWYGGLLVFGSATLVASIALVSVAWIAFRRDQAERAALAQLNIETESRLTMERRLHAAHRLEAIGQLTAGLAHEFNNLLSVVLGNLELLGNPKNLLRSQQLSRRARNAAERGARLTSSLLAFARQQMLQTEVIGLNADLGELLPALKRNIGKAIEVELVLDPALCLCNADRGSLEAALSNLVSNARESMPKGGKLTITTRNTNLTAFDLSDNTEATPGAFVAVAVCDTGCGMDDEVKGRAFEPFFTTRKVGAGSGLGLSQVFGFVRQAGGHVTLDSELGRGTTVTLFLPQVNAASEDASPRAGLSAEGRAGTR